MSTIRKLLNSPELLACPKRLITTYGKRKPAILKNVDSDKLPIYDYALKNAKFNPRVFMWGSAVTGALGNPNFLRPKSKSHKPLLTMHHPVTFSFTDKHKVHDVACGFGFTVFLVDGKREVYGTGLNTDSQLGYHAVRRTQPLETIILPVPITLPIDAGRMAQVSCGRGHTLLRTEDGNVLSLGSNCFGQCGRPIDENEEYFGSSRIHRLHFDGHKIADIKCGPDHSLFITDEGAVWSCGWGVDGQTGQGHFSSSGQPALVQGDIVGERIIKVASSADCCLAINDSGEVFGWGNSEYGQLHMASDELQVSIARHLKLDLGRIVDIAVTGTSCLLLNEHGHVYVWGYGLIGLGPQVQEVLTPTQIPPPLFGCNELQPESTVVRIYSGLSHFAAITTHGELFMWGKNRRACLGMGDLKDISFPMRVCMGAFALKISCGMDHTFAICKSYIV